MVAEEINFKAFLQLLRKPFGKLYPNIQELLKVKELKVKKIVAVGDIVSYSLLLNGIEPFVIVYDGKTKRKKVKKEIKNFLENFSRIKIIVKNPRRKITPQLLLAIKNALASNKKVAIFVRGEEDLCALPAIAYAKKESLVVYGFPFPNGIVVAKINKRTKQKAKGMLKKFLTLSGKSHIIYGLMKARSYKVKI